MSWWRRGVIYQVYPRSFADSDGDGVGDLRGIAARLDYLDRLGVDAVWLSPFYRSPMDDFGYDMSDHCDVEPMFGTLDDFDVLVAAAHARGLRVILDFVPNHTSDEHPWFARAPRLVHLARPAPDGGPPNNWSACSAARRGRRPDGPVLLPRYLREQPDLDWRNPEVARDARRDALLARPRRGRLPRRRAHQVMKDPELRDNPPARPTGAGCRRTTSCSRSTAPPRGPRAGPRWRATLAERGGVAVGEIHGDRAAGPVLRRRLHMPSNFP